MLLRKHKLKQQLQAKAQRVKRFEKRQKFFHQNKTFKENAKSFYKEPGKKTIDIKAPPKIAEVEDFWRNTWEKEKHFSKNAEWISQIGVDTIQTNQQEWPQITLEETKTATQRSSNWKAPGNDGIAKFWIKNLSSNKQDLTNAYNECIKKPEACPEWFTTGTTYLLSKTEKKT